MRDRLLSAENGWPAEASACSAPVTGLLLSVGALLLGSVPMKERGNLENEVRLLILACHCCLIKETLLHWNLRAIADL